MDFDKLIKKRASIRKYSDKKVNILKIIDIIEAANLAPSPGNLDILRYIIIDDEKKINKLADASQQPYMKKAPIIIVVCSDPKRARLMYDSRAEIYIHQHAGAAIEHLLLKITDLGLVSCWIGAYVDTMVKELLGISEEINVEALIPVSYPVKLDKTKQKTKPNIDGRIYFNSWKNKYYKKEPSARRDDI